ncbi:uncharacterized protein LOC129720433 [Wyeomyia smithii]|uniref:uncharacterized protein LOC129720433 n=1 Tax=Wyeomyia smithii TaxID=174621 RepID=UPI00246818B8|nr:uncharacterized protein LOC129720433 [Wyeomyia smithii]
MNKLLIVFALVGVIIAAPSQRDESDDDAGSVGRCVDQLVNSMPENIGDDMVAFIADTRETFEYLIDRRRRCDELPRDDPPTRLQELAIEACITSWQVRAAAEIARLTATLAQRVPNAQELMGDFARCMGVNLEEIPMERDESDEEAGSVSECVDEELVDDLVAFIADTRQTFTYLMDRRRRCDELARDDPPTWLQELAIEACYTSWQVRAAAEMTRLTAALARHVRNAGELMVNFSRCLRALSNS